MSDIHDFPREAGEAFAESALHWDFIAKRHHDMFDLGTAFSGVLEDMLSLSERWGRAARIGLCGRSGVGKTVLVAGMFEDIRRGAQVVDKNYNIRQQFVVAVDKGHIRYYDAAVGVVPLTHRGTLASYFNNQAEAHYGVPLLDIVEHPDLDRHNKRFDVFLSLRACDRVSLFSWRRVRHVMAVAHPAIVEKPGFQAFLRHSVQGPG